MEKEKNKDLLDFDVFDNGNGYESPFSLSESELNNFKKYISKQWFKNIENNNPKVAKRIRDLDIDISSYHTISESLEHSKIWPKTSRILSREFVDWFFKTTFFDSLKKKYGSIEISDEERLGFPNIYWRLVRPNEKKDIGPLHRDSWFWELNKSYPNPEYKFRRLKVWIPIYVEKGLNGLLIEPNSQLRKDIIWKGELRDGINKPVLLSKMSQFTTKLIEIDPGGSLVFDDNLIHGGAINKGLKTRVSIEFTLIVKDCKQTRL